MSAEKRKYHKRGELIDGYQARKHPLYTIWVGMMQRCYNDKAPNFISYGGRGITVCDEWHQFKNFAADMGERPEGTSIDRVDNDSGYGPDNCRWATRSQQCMNRRLFSNNTSGERGIKMRNGRFHAQVDYGKVRYQLGWFATLEEAVSARDTAHADIENGKLPDAAPETIWATSSSGVRGVTPHADGGYIVRTTVNGERKYLGYFKTLEDAIDAKRSANTK